MVMDFVMELVDDVPGIVVVGRVCVEYGVGGGGGPEWVVDGVGCGHQCVALELSWTALDVCQEARALAAVAFAVSLLAQALKCDALTLALLACLPFQAAPAELALASALLAAAASLFALAASLVALAA